VRADARQLAPAVIQTSCQQVPPNVSTSAFAYPVRRAAWSAAIAVLSSTNATAPRLIRVIPNIQLCPCCSAPATKQRMIRGNRQARRTGSWIRTAAEVSRGFRRWVVMPVIGARKRDRALNQSLQPGTAAGTKSHAFAQGCSMWNAVGYRSSSFGTIAAKRRLRGKPPRGTPLIK
jgi:hypothetical protein